ncbi:hypothetical protein FC80_GL000273 [Liquorilactobacillus cacaonum DSM 21116]|uniref:Integral membrane protein n=2 Tax=Liquorilactobacillus cacaonum TaxID=483012 RepID=A0A0R2CW17_9LACO|nr:hypothetical protein FC80_GL000273 [Liquorilactobacillus cacaonum DSM 21116]
MQVGDKLVKELKTNNSLQWHFVSAKQALQGMKNKKYYTIITIPKNFSKNATTVLDKNPKKMELTYKTNDSLNYIGKVISEEGAKQLNTEINSTVTKAYASAMFATIKKVGKGFTTASKGATKLKIGSTTLSDGLNTYTAGVKKVNDGTQTLNSSTGTLASGVNKLATGSNTLSSGLGTYTSGVGTLSSGLSKLSNNSNALNQGIQELASSTSELPTAAAGFYVLNNSLAQDISQINSALQANKDNVSSMYGEMSKINTELNSSEFQQQLSTLENLASQTDSIKLMVANLKTTMETVSEAKKDFSSSLSASLTQIAKNSTAVSYLAKSMESESNMTTEDKANLEKIIEMSGSTTDSSANTSATSNMGEISNIEDAATTLNAKTDLSSLAQELDSMDSLVSELDSLSTAVDNLSGLMNTSNKLTDVSAQTMVKSILTLTDKVSQLKELSATAATSATQFNSKVNASSPEIDATELTSTESIQKEVATIASTSTLTSEVSKLVSGVSTYTSGTKQANSGASQLAANSAALTSGASQLSTGLGTLNSSVPTLTSGVTQLASGTAQLNDNSASLLQGSLKLASGNKALAKALDKGAKQVNAVKTSNKTARMFASPSKLVHKNYSTVPNYGYALAPYMLSVALYVGALVFNLVYPIRRFSTPDGTGTEWFLSKISIGAVVAVGTALVETLLMMAAGLVPNHPVQMILNAIIFSLTAMYLVMLLSMAGGNPGRFAGMILLVLQLGGSGGSFPINITNGMDGFFQLINPYLPMTYSILGFREALTSGLGSGQIATSIGIMLIFMVISLILLWVTMVTKRRNGSISYIEPTDEEKTTE